MDDLKIWSVEDANAAIPAIREKLPRVRVAAEAQRMWLERASDLARDTRDAVRDPTHALHATYADALRNARRARDEVEAASLDLATIGVEVKDPFIGLVDFPTMRGHEVVYLCWREGEREVAHWHPLAGGFSARKPLDALVRAGGR